MPALLISVRSAAEARQALNGGAAVIDVKEPDRGPLGRADPQTWQAIRAIVPPEIPLSVALGELADWEDAALQPSDFHGITYRKIGLAQAPSNWPAKWAQVRHHLGPGPAWVAVAYADHNRCQAPHPDEVLKIAIETSDCLGLLVDTWDKSQPCPINESWAPWINQAQAHNRFVALAGSLDEARIQELAPLHPDLFAIRGAACHSGDRRGTIDSRRVQILANLLEPENTGRSLPRMAECRHAPPQSGGGGVIQPRA